MLAGKVYRFEAIDRRRTHAHAVPINCEPSQFLKMVGIINRTFQMSLYARTAGAPGDKGLPRKWRLCWHVSKFAKDIQMNRAIIGVNQARRLRIPICFISSEIVMMHRSIDDNARIFCDV